MRRHLFVRHAADRVAFMFEHGYDSRKLLRLARRFMQRFYLPRPRWRGVWSELQRAVARRLEDPITRAARDSRCAAARRESRRLFSSRTASPSGSRTASPSGSP